MVFNVSLIQLNGKVNCAKNAVISVLTEKWPLTTKNIFDEAQSKFAYCATYQAIHKTIKELEKDKILLKEGTSYKLNPEWIEKEKQFSEQLSEAYKPIKKEGPSMTLPTIYDTDKFLLNMMLQNLPKEGEKPFIGMQWNHCWVPLFLSIKEYSQLKDVGQKFDFYSVSRGDTKIDKWCAKFWNAHGMKKKTGVDCAALSDIVIFGDTIIEIFQPPELKRKLNEFYEKAKSIEDLNIPYLFEHIFQKKTEINIVMHKNKELAEQLKEQTKSYFKKGKK
ncbi:Uncharacterised protein [uncultured archaeon]|nr:Uncharacterised protein [uncultured archaeon]